MPPMEITRTRLASASLNIDPPFPVPENPAAFILTGTIEIRMMETEKIGGAPAQVREFPVTDKNAFRVTLGAPGQADLPTRLTVERGRMNWRMTRGFRFDEGVHLVTATLQGSVNEIDMATDLRTGKVTRNRSRPKGVNRSESVPIRVRR